ncbi:MAG: hypothetical protein ACI837_001533, partial [Crocinitomicaceae bacterium]
MKRIITLVIAVLLTASLYAQAPQKLSYQAVIRDGSQMLVTDQTIGMRIRVLQGSPTGISLFVETHECATNINGMATIEIGVGTTVFGNFATIDWSNGPYFIITETDPTGGTAYSIIGTSQLMSVPYALYAANSGSSTPGPQGIAGPPGATGTDGIDGAVGPQGPVGLTGADGIDGINGSDGIDGAVGAQGPMGLTGADGIDGAVGAQGPMGLTGADGIDGIDGAVGPQGPMGLTGADGIDGAVGAQGPMGL